LLLIRPLLQPVYLALDGHFGNYPAFLMVQICGLQLISKLRHDAVLCFPFNGEYKGSGPHPKYGQRVDYQHIPERYLQSITVEKGIQTCTYQAQLLHPDFPGPLNVVIRVKTNLTTHAWVYVILFSSDLACIRVPKHIPVYWLSSDQPRHLMPLLEHMADYRRANHPILTCNNDFHVIILSYHFTRFHRAA
jgi:hypothetical protein